MSSFDDQYDAPLSGVERARVQALQMAMAAAPLVDGSLTEKSDQWVEMARVFERYIIGQRATGVQERIDEAYSLASKLLAKADPWTEDGEVAVALTSMRELVKLLSGLAEVPF